MSFAPASTACPRAAPGTAMAAPRILAYWKQPPDAAPLLAVLLHGSMVGVAYRATTAHLMSGLASGRVCGTAFNLTLSFHLTTTNPLKITQKSCDENITFGSVVSSLRARPVQALGFAPLQTRSIADKAPADQHALQIVHCITNLPKRLGILNRRRNSVPGINLRKLGSSWSSRMPSLLQA